jgi:hypothetical protein
MAPVMDVRSTRVGVGAVVTGVGLLLTPPALARADAVPVITQAPVILGSPQVGAELTASAEWTGDPEPVATWAWQRCVKENGSCSAIAGSTKSRYVVSAADLGTYLRVRLKVTNAAGSVTAQSKPTTRVLGAPAPTPTPTPTPTATPNPTPQATPVASPVPTAVPVAAPPPVVAPPAPLVPLAFDPFPVVRIKGLLTPTGARVTLLSVRAPRDARIDVSCTGKDCPVRHYRSAGGKRRLRKFERSLRAGTRLQVRVTKPGYVGKFTEFVIRRQAEPKRSDRCLAPGATRPVACS